MIKAPSTPASVDGKVRRNSTPTWRRQLASHAIPTSQANRKASKRVVVTGEQPGHPVGGVVEELRIHVDRAVVRHQALARAVGVLAQRAAVHQVGVPQQHVALLRAEALQRTAQTLGMLALSYVLL